MGLVLGSRFGRYRIDAIAGRGGMATVFRATDVELERPVAIKVLAAELADDPTFRDRFTREAKLLAALDHPYVVPIYEAGEVDGLLFLALRYIPGRDLGVVLRLEGPLDATRALRLLGQVAEALDAAHAIGLVHRDVKAENVLVSSDTLGREVALLADFGLTRRVRSGTGPTMAGQLVGSVGAIAPEQLEGRPPDGRSDQYALACLLFECVGGAPPFSGESDTAVLYQHAHAPPPDVRTLRPDLPPAFAAVIARGLAKDPALRYAACSELIDAAAEAVGRRATSRLEQSRPRTTPTAASRVPAVTSSPPAPGARSPRSHVDRRWAAALVLVPLAAGAVILFATLSTSGPPPPGQPAAAFLSGRIVFVGGAGRDRELYSMEPDGSEVTRLTDNAWADMSPALSTDGRSLAFAAERQANRDIYLLAEASSPPERLTISSEPDDQPAWSPNGQTIAFTRGGEGSDLNIIANAFASGASDSTRSRSERVTTGPATDDGATWAPVGVELAMSSDRAGAPHIWRLDAEIDDWRPVTEGPGADTLPAWSPDGGWIAFVRATVDGQVDLFRVRPDGTDLERLTQDPAIEGAPTWSPDGAYLAFVRGEDDEKRLVVHHLRTGAVDELDPGIADIADPSWGPVPQELRLTGTLPSRTP